VPIPFYIQLLEAERPRFPFPTRWLCSTLNGCTVSTSQFLGEHLFTRFALNSSFRHRKSSFKTSSSAATERIIKVQMIPLGGSTGPLRANPALRFSVLHPGPAHQDLDMRELVS
jgi:hypothetical protein